MTKEENVEITKELLELRRAAMTQQLGRLLEETAMVRGALNMCNALMAHLETVEAQLLKPEGSPETPEGDGSEPAPVAAETERESV